MSCNTLISDEDFYSYLSNTGFYGEFCMYKAHNIAHMEIVGPQTGC